MHNLWQLGAREGGYEMSCGSEDNILLFIGLVKTSLWQIWLILVCPGFDIGSSRLGGEPNIKSWTDQYHLKLGENRQKFDIWWATQWRAKYQIFACLNPILSYLSKKLVLARPINVLYGECTKGFGKINDFHSINDFSIVFKWLFHIFSAPWIW